jgi:hypothetical protein
MVAEENEIDGLFSGPLSHFTVARNALAQRLTAEGDRDAAQRVRQLRKPTVTAWAVNQLVHQHRDRIEELLEATGRVRDASNASALRAATKKRTQIVSSLVDTASQILEGAGNAAGPAQLERITQTLLAGTSTDEYRDELIHGRLTKDLQPGGFADAWGLAETFIAGEDVSDAQSQRDDERRAAEELGEAAAAEERRAAQLEQEAESAERLAQGARRAADRAHAKAIEARRRADEALAGLTTPS